MIEDPERCYRALLARDARFDGWFFVAVRTTKIYCRPSCPAVTPKREHVTFHETAASAQAAGYRACRRCRPDTTPGSPEWDVRGDLAGRAMRLIADGLVDREGVAGLARRMAVSERHLHRVLLAELGAGPQALARAQRAQTARLLIETTDLPITELAFAAGYASIRQFNDSVREAFGATPSTLRAARRQGLRRGRAALPPADVASEAGVDGGAPSLRLRLATRTPFDGARLLAFLGLRAVPGIEAATPDGGYRRVLDLAHGPATVELRPADDHVAATLRLTDLRDLASAVERCRRILDLDADPHAIDELLGADPLLAPLVAARPGLRAPGAADGFELAVRAVIGQQVSVAGARTVAGKLVTALGKPLTAPDGPLTHAFPAPDALAGADPSAFPMPRSRGRALVALAEAVADGRLALDPGADRAEVVAGLVALPGIGPWTASYVALRALGDPDGFLPTDLGVRRALEALGRPGDPKAAEQAAVAWRPWRTYALHHLWASLG